MFCIYNFEKCPILILCKNINKSALLSFRQYIQYIAAHKLKLKATVETQAVITKIKLNLRVTRWLLMSYPQDLLFHSREIHPDEPLTVFQFSSVRPYITQRGNTLSQPAKQHWFVTLLCFIAGWISSKTASVSICLSDSFCISERKICQGSCGFVVYFVLHSNSLSCLHSCWWSSSWNLLAVGPLILAPQLWSIFSIFSSTLSMPWDVSWQRR